MKKHFILTAIAYLYFGFGLAVQNLGIKAGLGLEITIGIFASSVIFYIIIVFTSLEKVKKALHEYDKKKEEITFEFETTVTNTEEK